MANLNWQKELLARTKSYAIRIVTMFRSLPRNQVAFTFGRQVLRSGTSVGAHYREACRARSTLELASKLGGLLQELDETKYWLELLVDTKVVSEKRMKNLLEETAQLAAIFTKSLQTSRTKLKKR